MTKPFDPERGGEAEWRTVSLPCNWWRQTKSGGPWLSVGKAAENLGHFAMVMMAGLGWARVPEAEQRLALVEEGLGRGKGSQPAGQPHTKTSGLAGPETAVAKKPLRSTDPP